MSTTKDSKRILSVTIKRMIDDSPDTSWLGEFSDSPEQYAIVHIGEHSGEFADKLPCECSHSESEHDAEFGTCFNYPECDCETFTRDTPERGREYRYFNPVADNYTGGCTEEEIEKYCLADYERMRGLNNNQWCFVGVRADAQVKLNGDLVQDITSGGLWGIESDSGDYFKEVESEQLVELKDQLHAMGFTKRAIAAAFRNVEHKDE